MKNWIDPIKKYGPLLLALLLIVPAQGLGEEKTEYLYYNENGGKYYHSTPTCSAVMEEYWPLTAFPAEELHTPAYHRLLPCRACVLKNAWGTPDDARRENFFPMPTPRPTAGPGEISEQEAVRLFREAMTEEFGEERAEQLDVIIDYYPSSEYYDAFYHLEAVIPISKEEQEKIERAFERWMAGEDYDDIIHLTTYESTGFAQNLDAKNGMEYSQVSHER